MRARIPAGIDLEDRLLYGLSPARLGYVAGLAALASWFWRQPVWGPLRILPAMLLLAAAAAVGWFRHEGRHLDQWARDLVLHVIANYSLGLDWAALPKRLRRLSTVSRGHPL